MHILCLNRLDIIDQLAHNIIMSDHMITQFNCTPTHLDLDKPDNVVTENIAVPHVNY